MEGDELSEFLVKKPHKQYTRVKAKEEKTETETVKDDNEENSLKREPLTTKNAVKFLLEGNLKLKVCRYCLNVDSVLYEMDHIFEIGGQGTLYKVTIRDMVASFHPFQVTEDPNFPNKICTKCVDNSIQSYLFTQQCERTGRALHNCFEDMYEKLEKLDPLERTKKRGRYKLNPNHNIIYAEHEKVINYADPIINIVNKGSQLMDTDKTVDKFNELQCPKCWQSFTSLECLLNHEKIHPKHMWFSCPVCGRSFAKRHLYRKHVKTAHDVPQQVAVPETGFKCLECDVGNETYHQHLQHIEKHKFHTIMEHLVERKMDKLCTVCLSKGANMIKLDKTVNIHGGCPELTGQRSLYNILGSTLPEMNILSTYTGTKICGKCLDHAITSYIFLNHAHYVRNRLNTCVELMLDCLLKVDQPDGKIFVEISQNIILPAKEPDFIDENLLIESEEEIDESKLTIEVLEDEFRTKDSESESDSETTSQTTMEERNTETNIKYEDFDDQINNQASSVTKTYGKGMLNGLQARFSSSYNSISNICSEFLTFKKKRKPKRQRRTKFTCPLCSKHFISDYFLRRHLMKHVLKKVQCKTCHIQFNSKFYMYEHTKMMHLLASTKYSTCKICGRTFVNRKKFIKHIKTHRHKECGLCGKIFATQKHYDTHMQRHTLKLNIIKEKGVQTCNFCEKACLNDNDLSVHVNKIHLQIKPYSCDMCERQFYTEANLNNHKKVHNIYSKERCNFCSKSLRSRKALVIHVRRHIGVTPFVCQMCTQRFHSQGELKKHMKIFHGGKFLCKLCKTVFANKYGLKAHRNRVHNII